MAFATRRGVPARWGGRNDIDASLAVWAQTARVPLWIPAHPGTFATPLQPCGTDSIFLNAQQNGYMTRTQILETIHWTTHTLPPGRLLEMPAQSMPREPKIWTPRTPKTAMQRIALR